jgi:hypothetical protein
MLAQDITNRLVPYNLDDDREHASLLLTPPDKNVERLVCDGISRGQFSQWCRQFLSDAFREFAGLCAMEILIAEMAVFEIVLLSDSDAKEVAFELCHVDSASLSRDESGFVQSIPEALAQRLKKPPKIHLPDDHLLVFQAPAYVRGKLPEIMEVLSQVSGPPSPSFAFPNDPTRPATIPFDFNFHEATRSKLIAQVTRDIGWNARSLLEKHLTEHYFLSRELSFAHFIIRLRDEILRTLNDGLKVVGKRLNFSAMLSTSGLPGESEIESARAELTAGSAPFNKVFETFR